MIRIKSSITKHMWKNKVKRRRKDDKNPLFFIKGEEKTVQILFAMYKFKNKY